MSYLTNRVLFNTIPRILRLSAPSMRGMAAKIPSPEELDKPINYLGSPAAQWKAQWSTRGQANPRPWIESWSILASITVFMLYFCVLREENDIDEHLKQPLYDSVPGLEEQNLVIMRNFNLEHGKDNQEVEQRMKELGMKVGK